MSSHLPRTAACSLTRVGKERGTRALGTCVTFLLLLIAATACRDATSVESLSGGAPGSLRPRPNHTPAPLSVTLAGSFQSEIGCTGDWQPDCAISHLAYDAADDVWHGTWAIPVQPFAYEYKVALNDDWAENYGKFAFQNGPNLQLLVATPIPVKFYYDHESHWITDNVNSVIATAVGSFQSELGCAGDWAPDCLRSWLQDADGDGVYTFSTDAIPEGAYEVKVAIRESWDENYGAEGVPAGANIPFAVPAGGATVVFQYNATTHLLTVKLAQSITFTSVAPSPASVGGTYTVSATATSGLDVIFSSLTPLTCNVVGSTVSFLSAGTCSVAADQPGNATYLTAPRATQSIEVGGWAFTGFFAPVASAPAFNDATAGSTIPIKFSLGGDQGLVIFLGGSPSSAVIACPTAAPTQAIVAAAGSAKKSTLTYDATTGVYTYSWATDRKWANSCRALTLAFIDGTTREAYFRFR